MHLFTPQILHNHCFQFLLGFTVVPWKVKDNGHNFFSISYFLSFFGGGGGGGERRAEAVEKGALYFR